MAKPINIFIIYAREDKEIKQKILAYLNPFVKPYNLVIWHDDYIEPGQEWKPHIESRLNQTDLFVLLVSIDFMNSKFINQVEFKYAVERHKTKRSIVIPVIINYCPWDIDFEFDDFNFSLSELQVLPDEGKPIDDWKTPAQAYNNVATGIRKVFTSLKNDQQQQEMQEDALWNQAAQKKDISSYNEYLKNFPKGKFSERARTGISILQEQEKETLEGKEDERQKQMEHDEETLWKQAEEENSNEGYHRYISEYPAGRYKSTALSVIRTLENITKKRQKEDEDKLWKSSCDINTIAAYANYLGKTELGLYRAQANTLIAEIEKKNQGALAKQERASTTEQEKKLWQEAKGENSITAYEIYLHSTTPGLFKEKAHEIINQLEARQKEKEQEQQLWENAKTENTINSYNGYSQHYPNGMYITDASTAIKAIEDAERKQQQVLVKKVNAQDLETKKKDIPKKYYLVVGSAVLIAVIILLVMKFSTSDSGSSKINTQTDSAALIPQATPGKTEQLSRADAYYIQKKFDSAVSIYIRNSDALNAEEQFNLGVMYDNGTGVPEDDAEAVKWYRKAADRGFTNAQNSLGVMYARGTGVQKDDAEAVKWYRKAAEQGNAVGQYNLGCMYRDGTGVQKDYIEAVKWCRKAADQGDADAQNSLGFKYHTGTGVQKDDKEAVKWYRKAAEQGNATAQSNLGIMYEGGEGVPEDDAEAVKWYRKAADQGYADAQTNLGVMYDNGTGVEKDDKEAVKWYRKAAEQGNTNAKRRLTALLEQKK